MSATTATAETTFHHELRAGSSESSGGAADRATGGVTVGTTGGDAPADAAAGRADDDRGRHVGRLRCCRRCRLGGQLRTVRPQMCSQFRARLDPQRRVLRHRSSDHRIDPFRCVGGEPGNLFVGDPPKQRQQVGRRDRVDEWWMPLDQCVQRGTECIDVRRRLRVRPGQRLRWAECGRQRKRSRLHRRTRVDDARDAEVCDERPTRQAAHQVCRFQIAMYESLFVRELDRLRDVGHHVDRFGPRQRAPRLELVVERPREQGHHEVRLSLRRNAAFVHRDDAVVLGHPAHRPLLAAETTLGPLVGRSLQDLDGDVAVEGLLAAPVDECVAAFADHLCWPEPSDPEVNAVVWGHARTLPPRSTGGQSAGQRLLGRVT